jgi:zinc protease
MTGNELIQRLTPLEKTLSNGLRLLVLPDRAAPVAAIVTYVQAGYFDEPDEVVGISHVLEHMFFKGTRRRGVGEIARQTKAAGGYLNAGTIYDHTSYYTVLPSAEVELGLDLQADALMNSVIDAAELEKELQVIVEEVKRKFDNPSAMTTETLFEVMFDEHPMRRWRMGSPEALVRLTREDVHRFYRRMYRGGNVILVVSGDVDAARIVDRVEALYGDLEPGGDARKARREPPRTGSRLREMVGDVAHAYAELGWATPGTLDPRTPALDALAMVLGQGRASRLYRGVREEGLASAVDAFNYTPTEIGVFGMGLEAEPHRLEAALGAAWRQVEDLCAQGPTTPELDRVRTLLGARLLRRLETAEGRANLLAEWAALGDWRLAGDYLDRLRELEPDHLREAAVRSIDADRATLVVYRPTAAPPLGWPPENVGDRLRERSREHAPTPAPAVPPPSERPVPTATTPTPRSSGDGVEQFDVPGGRLVVKRRPHAPLVSMAIFRPGGVIREDPTTAGATDLMLRATLRGTRTRSAEQIALESEAMGGSIGASAGPDLLSWSLTVPAESFAAGFDILADVADEPAFPEDAVARERAMVLASLDRLRDDMYRYPLRLFLKAAFGGHPYGRSPEEVARSVQELTAADLERWHREALGEPWIFIVGDVEPEAAAALVTRRWRPTMGESVARPEETGPAAWREGPGREEVRRDRAQSALTLGFPGPRWSHADRIPMELLAGAVSGLGNRLFEELRSRRSLAYTVMAQTLSRREAGAFLAYIATSASQADEARDALLDQLRRLRLEPPTEEELERARRSAVGSWQIRSQTNGAQLSELAAALLLGNGVEDITGYVDRVQAVRRDDLLDAAGRWFDEERLAEGLVRGAG